MSLPLDGGAPHSHHRGGGAREDVGDPDNSIHPKTGYLLISHLIYLKVSKILKKNADLWCCCGGGGYYCRCCFVGGLRYTCGPSKLWTLQSGCKQVNSLCLDATHTHTPTNSHFSKPKCYQLEISKISNRNKPDKFCKISNLKSL